MLTSDIRKQPSILGYTEIGIFLPVSNKTLCFTCKTSHHSRIETPETQSENLRLDPDALTVSGALPHHKALGIRDIRWDLICPGVAPLQCYAVVLSKPADTEELLVTKET